MVNYALVNLYTGWPVSKVPFYNYYNYKTKNYIEIWLIQSERGNFKV